jgi:hypothetical protein
VNSGVFAFRRGTSFAPAFEDSVSRLMQAGVSEPGGNYYFHEQNSLILAVASRRLRFHELPLSNHHTVFPYHIDNPALPSIAESRLIHYSGSMSPAHWPRFMERFRRERPEHYEWLREHGPVDHSEPPRTLSQVAHKLVRKVRGDVQRWKCRRNCAAHDAAVSERRSVQWARQPVRPRSSKTV